MFASTTRCATLKCRTVRYKSSFAVALETASKLVSPRLLWNNPISLVSNEMNTLAKNIMALIGSGHPTLNRVTSYYFETEGKKVRPLLVLLLSRALSEIPLKERDNIDLKNHKAKLHFYASSDVKSLKNTAKIWLNL